MTRRHSYFSLEEANALLPTLEHFFREIALVMKQMRALQSQLKKAGAKLTADGIHLPRAAMVGTVAARDQYVDCCRAYDAMMEELLHLGIEVVDVEAGVVNFYTWWDNEEVVLNWQFGEPAVQFWLDPGETYMARRPLRQLFFDAPAGPISHH